MRHILLVASIITGMTVAVMLWCGKGQQQNSKAGDLFENLDDKYPVKLVASNGFREFESLEQLKKYLEAQDDSE